MNIGRCYFHTNRYINAAKWFNLAIKCEPKSPDGYYCLAATNLKLGDFEGARTIIRKIDILGATHDEDPFVSNRRQSRASMASKTSVEGGKLTPNEVSRKSIGMNRNVF
jgi:tetratricopeptide (TPR) repeat protein